MAIEVFGDDVLDDDLALGHRREADEARDLDVVRADAPFAAVQRLDPADVEDVRADPVDLGAEGDQEPAKILDVGLARRVADHRLARRQHRGHDDVLRSRHRRLVEEDLGSPQAVRAHAVDLVGADVRAKHRERVNVRVEPAAPDDVAAWRRDDGLAVAGEKRPREEDGCADTAAEHLVELELRDARARDANLAAADALDVGAKIGGQVEHRLDIRDRRDVRERDGLVGEQAGGHDRQGRVLVSGRADRPRKRPRALDDESLHQGIGYDCVLHFDGSPCARAATRTAEGILLRFHGGHPRASVANPRAVHEV